MRPYFQLAGGVNGWASLSPRRFNLEGGQEACVGIPFLIRDVELCQGVNGLVSSAGFHACVKNIVIPAPPFFVPEIGLGHRWGSGPIPDITLFSCRPGEYREVQPALGARSAGARTAQARRSFVLPRGLPSAQVRVVGRGGAPAVDVRGPGGVQIAVPREGEDASGSASRSYAAMRLSDTTVQIGLRKPARGSWTVTPRAGSAPISRVEVAEGLPGARIRARVSGRGHTRVLRYRVRPAIGQRVRFVEQGVRTYRELGVAKGRAGTIRFAPAAGARGRRRIVALVEQRGVTVERRNVTRYSAPADARPAKPRGLRVRRRGSAINLRWRRVRGAKEYGVIVRLSNRRRIFRVVKRPRLTLRGFHRLARGRVSVQALRLGQPSSRPAKARDPCGAP